MRTWQLPPGGSTRLKHGMLKVSPWLISDGSITATKILGEEGRNKGLTCILQICKYVLLCGQTVLECCCFLYPFLYLLFWTSQFRTYCTFRFKCLQLPWYIPVYRLRRSQMKMVIIFIVFCSYKLQRPKIKLRLVSSKLHSLFI